MYVIYHKSGSKQQFSESNLKIFFGSTLRGSVGSNRWDSEKYVIQFDRYQNHPEWDNLNIKSDVGVLILTEDLELQENVAIISLDFEWVAGGVESIVTGWGFVEVSLILTVVFLLPNITAK